MVLFKRKPVQYLPQPPIDDDSSEVWFIPETGEVFTDYEAYLQRMDFYKQRRFICEITGHSGMSFFEALKSETAGQREVESQFPDPLKAPVLRKVQFSTISRIDNLVDHVFEEFKQDFYPGEVVTVVLDDSTRLNGQVREKARFPEIKRADGSISRKAVSRYFVRLLSRPDEEALVDDEHIVRDRKVFTKQMLRSFIKSNTDREAWNGAPWLVKAGIAQEYRIDTNVPVHLQYGSRQQDKKEKAAKKTEQEGMFGVWQPHRLPELKPAVKGRKNQPSPEELHAIQQEQWEEYQRALHADPTFSHWAQQQQQLAPPGYEHYQPNPSYYMPPPNGHQFPPHPQYMPKTMPKPPPPPPPVKYPIEDLEICPVRDGTHRPAIKYIALSDSVNEITATDIVPGLAEQTVGLLLETWNMLNVYCQVLVLDSFTFDDFVDALQFSSDELDCELFVEIHCAILKKLVNSEHEQNGAIQISLPDLPDVDDEDEESGEDVSRVPTPTPEPEVPVKRTTRSSLNKVQFADDRRTRSRSNTADIKTHRASEMFDGYDWIQRLRKRDFRKGGWELVMVGLLNQLSGRAHLREACDRILVHLAPLDAEPTIETVRLQYATMDINLRAEALQIVSMLFLETKAVKAFLEEMSGTMTHFRKLKIEHQRARKESIAKLKALHDERRILAPEEKSPTPVAELEEQAELERLEEADVSIADSEDDEEPLTSRSLRRGHDRAAERKRKRDEEQERKEKAAEAKQNKGSKEYQKVLKQIDKERDKIDEAEEAIMNIDIDLAEADCHRTRVLGKDRFCNRYWWFERNAMPHAGLPDSSTADSEYANGRIWVQGPDDMEREGFIDVTPEEKMEYFRRFQLTPEERKAMEEGPTSVFNARQWGYYDSPEEVDMLIGWLDVRGVREIKLKKELNLQREAIIRHMEKREAYLTPREDSEEPMTRMSTRTKTYISQASHRCLKWANTAAPNRHVDPPPKPRGKGRKVVEEPMLPRTVSRNGKPLARQGTRYNF